MAEGKLESLEFSIKDWEFIATALKLTKMDYYEGSRYCRDQVERRAIADLGDQAGRLETEIRTKLNIAED
jgi:hypothetical protein